MENIKRALAYIRVSTDGQAEEGISLDAQKSRIRAYCEAQGYSLTGVFCDAGLSGKSLDRPQLQEALALLRYKQAEALVMLKLDRLSRSVVDVANLAALAERHGFALISVSENLDTSSAAGRFVLSILASLAQMEREVTIERTKLALRHLRDTGFRVGEIRFGYSLSADGKSLIRLETEQAVIRQILALRAKGLSYGKIAELLTIIKTPTKKGGSGSTWHPKLVRSLFLAHQAA